MNRINFLKNRKGQWAHAAYRTMREDQRRERVFRTKILLSKSWDISRIATALGVGTSTVRNYVKECDNISLSTAKGHFTVVCYECEHENYMFDGGYENCEKCGKRVKGGGCFIATASFGTPLAEEIIILKLWRDNSLIKNGLGRGFVRFYYWISPTITKIIRNIEPMKLIVRIFIRIFISLFYKPILWSI